MELIQSYMDKTLSEGCYIKINSWDWWDYGGSYSDIIDRMRCDIETLEDVCIDKCEESQTWYKTDYWDDVEILGHYDLTAVLKYVESIIWMDNIIFEWEYFQLWEWQSINYKIIGKIPNKPLHLYTEEEQTNLLELLKKLW